MNLNIESILTSTVGESLEYHPNLAKRILAVPGLPVMAVGVSAFMLAKHTIITAHCIGMSALSFLATFLTLGLSERAVTNLETYFCKAAGHLVLLTISALATPIILSAGVVLSPISIFSPTFAGKALIQFSRLVEED